MTNTHSLFDVPPGTLLRLSQIVATKDRPGMIPMSRSGFLRGVKESRFPAPIRLGERMVAWRAGDLAAAILAMNKVAA